VAQVAEPVPVHGRAGIVVSQSISVVNVLILLAVDVAAVAATYALYRRRDITV